MTTTVVRRLYFYAAALLGLQLLVAGASGLIAVLLEPALGTTTAGAPGETTFRLSLNTALVVVGLPLWAFHWWYAQRGVRAPDERRARLRRLYGYAVLAIAVVGLLSGMAELLGALLERAGLWPVEAVAAAIGSLIVNAAVWIYHWRAFAVDREEVEQSGGTATLRRWYLAFAQGTSLAIASIGAANLIDRLLRQAFALATSSPIGQGAALGLLIAGLAIWLPHHLWWRQLIRMPSALREDEARSSLRQVYTAFAIALATVATLGGLTALLYQLLLASFGQAAWRSLLTEQTLAVAIVIVGLPIWQYHRAQLGREALLSQVPARTDTARRVGGYLIAAIGLGALFFGLGGLLGTLLRMLLAPAALGAGWREPLSMYLALAVVALPVYGMTSRALERLARGSAAEERTLSRRIYLYAGLLFGVGATITALVWLVRLALEGLLGAGEANLPAEIARWAGYAAIGAAIAAYYALLVRRASAAKGDLGSGVEIALLAEALLREPIVAALAREAPGAHIQIVGATNEIGQPDMLIVSLQELIAGEWAASARAFSGPRLVLATPAAGYTLVGARRGVEPVVRELIGALKLLLSEAPAAPERPAGQALVSQVGVH